LQGVVFEFRQLALHPSDRLSGEDQASLPVGLEGIRPPIGWQGMLGLRARISHMGDGFNFFGGVGGFFIKGGGCCDIGGTWRDLSRDIGGFLPFSLRPLAITVSVAPRIETALHGLDFLNCERNHFGRCSGL
jgi:hypothetical protein